MPLGWIDFSKNDKDKVLNVISLLEEKGTLDELGIANIRDGFSNKFFPGTSTIQTRAKYFLIVPYTLKDLTRSGITDPKKMIEVLNETEKECAKILKDKGNANDGIIGFRTLDQGKWLRRTPSDIYWSGLKTYGILNYDFSIAEYIQSVCEDNRVLKSNERHISERTRTDGENDDLDAGLQYKEPYWNLPLTYKYEEWKKNLEINLTKDEAKFLKDLIINNRRESVRESMIAQILKENIEGILDIDSFSSLDDQLIKHFSLEIQDLFSLAKNFSAFIYVLKILYNKIISNNNNEEANNEWKRIEPELKERANIDLDKIYKILNITNGNLKLFLNKEKELLLNKNYEEMKIEITKRETQIKPGDRAKTLHPCSDYKWYGGKELDYRFNKAKNILNDIFKSLNK